MSSKKNKSEGFVDGLKTEWALFWDTILGDENTDENNLDIENDEEASAERAESKDPFINGKLEVLSLEQIKAITRALSSDRKKLNQRMESINKELELNTAKLESLKLVGGDFEEPLLRIDELNNQGQKFSEQLAEISERLKLARQREDGIKKSRTL